MCLRFKGKFALPKLSNGCNNFALSDLKSVIFSHLLRGLHYAHAIIVTAIIKSIATSCNNLPKVNST